MLESRPAAPSASSACAQRRAIIISDGGSYFLTFFRALLDEEASARRQLRGCAEALGLIGAASRLGAASVISLQKTKESLHELGKKHFITQQRAHPLWRALSARLGRRGRVAFSRRKAAPSRRGLPFSTCVFSRRLHLLLAACCARAPHAELHAETWLKLHVPRSSALLRAVTGVKCLRAASR